MLSECGYLIDESSIEKLKNAGLSSLIFSLDGSSAETHDAFRDNRGSFDSVLNAARTAKEAKVPFQFTTSLCRINTPEIIGIAHWARQLGATCLNAFILVPNNSDDYRVQDLILDPIQYESVLNELVRIKITSKLPVHVVCGPQFATVCKQARTKGLSKADGSCMGAKSYAFINSKGQVQLCGYLDHPAGDLLENGFDFASIWNESELFRVVRNQAEFIGPCKACEHMGLCSGCRARAFAANGDYLAGDPACSLKPKKRKRSKANKP
jgi:radical SAM protein with 4Fe4S-binding SPASM domain